MWFDDEMYQGATNQAFGAIHIYEKKQRIIAVFNKESKNFVTTCQLTNREHDELLETSNFVNGKD